LSCATSGVRPEKAKAKAKEKVIKIPESYDKWLGSLSVTGTNDPGGVFLMI